MICPKCGYAMDSFDRECPRCHGKGLAASEGATAPTVQAPTAAPVQPAAPRPNVPTNAAATKAGEGCVKYGCGCFGVFVLLILLLRVFGPGPGKLGEGAAYGMARRAIEMKLKAPSTAKFPASYEPGVSVVEKNDVFYINSHVDSQNGFGAMIRTKWVAAVQRTPDGRDMKLLFANLKE